MGIIPRPLAVFAPNDFLVLRFGPVALLLAINLGIFLGMITLLWVSQPYREEVCSIP